MTRRTRRFACALAVTVGLIGAAPSGGLVKGQALQPDAVIVGDSLTGGNATYIRSFLQANGLPGVRVEGLSARRIAVSFEFQGFRDSGIERIRSLKAQGVDPQLWVVQLGTNDLLSVARCQCPDPVAFAGALIDRLRAEIGPATPTAWVTVMNRDDYDVTNTFNEALRRRAAADRYFRLIDWAGLSLMQPEWFADSVHPNVAGLRPFSEMYVRDISALLSNLPGPPPPRSGTQSAVRIGGRLN